MGCSAEERVCAVMCGWELGTPKFSGKPDWEAFHAQFELLAHVGNWSEDCKALELAIHEFVLHHSWRSTELGLRMPWPLGCGHKGSLLPIRTLLIMPGWTCSERGLLSRLRASGPNRWSLCLRRGGNGDLP